MESSACWRLSDPSRHRIRRKETALFAIKLMVATLILQAPVDAQRTMVFAASSLASVVEALARDADREGLSWNAVFASSSTLARQIEHGAPADLYVSAHPRWMDYLEERDHLEPATRQDLVANTLVVIAHAEDSPAVQMERDFDFASTFEGRLAMGDPSHVPAGMYAKQALTSLGWWTALAHRLAPTKDVRAALSYVDLGECSVGIVYATDVSIASNVRIVAAFPADAHDPIVYPVAVVKGRYSDQVRRILAFLNSERAGDVFRSHGFRVLD